MGDDRKKSDAAFWTTVVIITVGLVLAYPLSIGPVVWILSRVNPPEWVLMALQLFYVPLQWACQLFEPAETAVEWYVALWMP